MKKGLALVLVLVGAAIGAALVVSPVDPAAFHPPPPPPLEGALAPNQALSSAEKIDLGGRTGPEDVDVDAEGRVYTGTVDGAIVRLTRDGESWRSETLATTGGRPLGLELEADGSLAVCDAVKGLLRLSTDGHLTTLATEAEGGPFGFTDDLDVAADGRLYFSDASTKFGVHDYRLDLLEARPHGRLLRYDPATGATERLLDGLYFANGVALAADESFVLVNETYRYRIRRYWLAGPNAGTSDLFADNLPGFPDNLSADGRGGFWVALFTVRNPAADSLHPHPLLKKILAVLPDPLWPKAEPYGFALHLDGEGRLLESLQEPGGATVRDTSSVVERGGALYFGSLTAGHVSRHALR